jgi:hypothetical protein
MDLALISNKKSLLDMKDQWKNTMPMEGDKEQKTIGQQERIEL